MPTTTTTQVGGTQPAPYVAPYLAQTLADAQALTKTPYMQYGGPRVADQTGLQSLAAANVGAMGAAPQLGQSGDMTTGVYNATRGLGSFTDPGVAQQWMNPYMQYAVQFQQDEAARQAAIRGQQLSSQAVRQGSFGGNRAALEQSELQRNLATQQGGIAATGANQAYAQGEQGYNQDKQSRLAALQIAQNAANQTGALGQQQYQQQLGIAGMQNSLGTQQQVQQQAKLDVPYQYYQEQREYPYKQVGFMSGIEGNSPGTTQATTQTNTTSPPNWMQQLAGLGIGAYSLGKLFGG